MEVTLGVQSGALDLPRLWCPPVCYVTPPRPNPGMGATAAGLGELMGNELQKLSPRMSQDQKSIQQPTRFEMRSA